MRKTVLITGGSRGIGRVTAMRLLLEGYSVAFTYASSGEAASRFEAEAGDSLLADGPRVAAFQGDVRDHARNEEIALEVLERFGSIDGLVNNAGIRRDALMYNMTPDSWREVMETNLEGAFSMTKAILPVMMRQRSGAIVNVASLSGLRGVVGQTNYSAAKGGLIAMTRSLSREVARAGIRVNCVAPGLVETEMIADMTADARKEMLRNIPMRRTITPDEVAAAIAFLISENAGGITGQVLCVDGGASA
jgi:3-oxoacyl-[acyl-carrier protein] reductase